MRPQDNVDTVRHAYLALREGNLDVLVGYLAEDVKLFSTETSAFPTSSTRQGRAQVAAYFSTLEVSEEIQGFQPKEFLAEGDKVVVFGESERRGQFCSTISPWVHIFTVRRDKISEFCAFNDTATAIEALTSMQVARAN